MKLSKVLDTMELGNLLWGHSRGRYPVNRKYQERFYENILKPLGYDSYGCEDLDFKGENTDRIIARPYFWGDEEDDPEEFAKPNFECKELGLELRWYKYPLRDSYSNIRFTNRIMRKLEKIAREESNGKI